MSQIPASHFLWRMVGKAVSFMTRAEAVKATVPDAKRGNRITFQDTAINPNSPGRIVITKRSDPKAKATPPAWKPLDVEIKDLIIGGVSLLIGKKIFQGIRRINVQKLCEVMAEKQVTADIWIMSSDFTYRSYQCNRGLFGPRKRLDSQEIGLR